MRIKKIYKSAIQQGKVLNEKSDSTSNTYCCDYLNDKIVSVGLDNNNAGVQFEVSRNLFNKNNVLSGYQLVAGSGNLFTNENYSVSDYIPVKPNTTYYSNKTFSTSSYGYVFYDKDSKYISGVLASNSTITTPNNCYSIRYTIKNTDLDTAQLEKGSTETSYEPYVVPNIKVYGETIANKNIYSTGEVVIGEWLGKPLYRKVIDCGALPNATTKNINHNISNFDTIVNISGVAKRTSDKTHIVIPFASPTLNMNIGVTYINNTVLQIITGNDRSTFDESYVILEYTKTTD